ncbi:MAG: VanZ family protein [Lachnospiraceae bacterium]|nr:VanZ family protein [Lachnospiraceae bacterium]
MRLQNKKGIIITLLIVICIMMMIFYFSAKHVTESDGMSRKIAGFLMPLIEWIYNLFPHDGGSSGSTLAASGGGLLDEINHYLRKLGHLTEFAMLGAAVLLHIDYICQYVKKINYKKNVAITILVVALYAISDEVHQIFVPGRGPGVRDVIIDSTGGILGCLLMLLIIKKIAKKRRNEQAGEIEDNGNKQS